MAKASHEVALTRLLAVGEAKAFLRTALFCLRAALAVSPLGTSIANEIAESAARVQRHLGRYQEWTDRVRNEAVDTDAKAGKGTPS
jgi:hypothetical protein